jgi:lipopolysaccharide cholinephosphotransferase
MLSFPDSFWEGETRNDFFVPAPMKRAWAIQMTMLDKTLEIAKKHNIKIWLDYGSLLGCIRHQGYIPWDDDIDACVLRDDYMKLLFILKDELPDYCDVFSFYN